MSQKENDIFFRYKWKINEGNKLKNDNFKSILRADGSITRFRQTELRIFYVSIEFFDFRLVLWFFGSQIPFFVFLRFMMKDNIEFLVVLLVELLSMFNSFDNLKFLLFKKLDIVEFLLGDLFLSLSLKLFLFLDTIEFLLLKLFLFIDKFFLFGSYLTCIPFLVLFFDKVTFYFLILEFSKMFFHFECLHLFVFLDLIFC